MSQFFVNHIWADLQRGGIKDPTRAATNPGLCNEVDERLHEWASQNGKSITAIIAGHTHRAVFENLSLTELRLQTLHFTMDDAAHFQERRDHRYYNTGSCVHPASVTGIEITFNEGPHLDMVEWGLATEGHRITVKRRRFSFPVS